MASDEDQLFDLLDYSVFGFMLVVSALVGVYFAFFAKEKQNNTQQYLMGGKTMGIFPISMSLIASYISGISLLGLPAEMYTYGTQYWMIVCPECFVSLTMALIYLPVFYKLQITSSYEYLKLRFNQPVRLMGSVIFVIKMLLYIPIVIYVPALAFSQVTGINLHLISPIVCVVCIFYTTLGGLKAVVWTDTIQTAVMFGGVLAVMFLGTIAVGGPSVVWERSSASGRLEFFNMDFDPTIRHTFWTVAIGNYFNWLATCSVNQAMVQRCLAMPSIKKANITIAILACGILSIVSMSCYTGLVIYAMFHNCDPVTNKDISKADQLLPYFVMKVTSGKIPGLPGLFVSGVFSAALSSMSTGLNSMTGVIFQDLIKPMYKKPITEERASFIMKIIVVIIGAICVALVFVVEKMGTLVQASKSLSGITTGSLLGVFSMGMFFPWANSKGALAGGISSLLFVGWISFGTQAEIAAGRIKLPVKPVSVAGCSADLGNFTEIMDFSPVGNLTSLVMDSVVGVSQEPMEPIAQVFALYRLSYLYYTLVGVVTTIVIGSAVSFLTGGADASLIHPDLFTPFVQKWLPKYKGPPCIIPANEQIVMNSDNIIKTSNGLDSAEMHNISRAPSSKHD
ncbi:LOW QUALITY PROTEIN: sodium-coupled monocarboxylate transporter 1-like [Ctenocephalides felis]|uniref:LOW QUALITY PROTEIN: sodium-coupled monocarboxylate transporter 1-like n=1 Tax=Ctenocephalides felis TaxID=7515 RepID=UPI000E6E2795|nr:LOW QUALITY PROTEIN: sodium-coupled monocarboxylate transporter 1-like [Ctenocephalides felis]